MVPSFFCITVVTSRVFESFVRVTGMVFSTSSSPVLSKFIFSVYSPTTIPESFRSVRIKSRSPILGNSYVSTSKGAPYALKYTFTVSPFDPDTMSEVTVRIVALSPQTI